MQRGIAYVGNGNGRCAVCACIENAKLWYPVGYGKQPLYILRIKDDGSIFHEETFGIRTVEIIETPDEKGSESYQKCLQIKNPDYDFNEELSSFTLVVNGEKIMRHRRGLPARLVGRIERLRNLF